MKYSTLILIVSLFVLFGCYDDKGNYDYRDINEITISPFSITTRDHVVGDTFHLRPTLAFSSGLTETSHLTYEWQFQSKTRPGWNTDELFWVLDTIASGKLSFHVTDTRTGIVYIQSQSYNISSEFDRDGWAVLAEKEGKSYLSFIKERYIETDGKEIRNDIIYKNVYGIKNHGEELGSNPLKLHEHFCVDNQTVGSLMIVQQGGQGMVDLDGYNFEKVITIDKAFAGGTLPADFKPVNAMSMSWVDLIQNYDGKLYSRLKATSKLFHSSAYLQTPMSYKGEELTQCNIVVSKFRNCAYALIHDAKYNRFLAVMDNVVPRSPSGIGKINAVPGTPDTGAPDNWVPLNNLGNNKVIYIGYFEPKSVSLRNGYFMILQDANGKFWHQEFVLARDYGKDVLYLRDCKVYPLDGLTNIYTPNSVIYALPYQSASEYVLISAGPDLYLYDRLSPTDPIKWYYKVDRGNISAINAEKYWHRQAAIGTDQGQCVILNMVNAKNLQSAEEKLLWQTPDNIDLGRIVDIRLKVRTGNNWNPTS